jgi:heptosyltransferase-1
LVSQQKQLRILIVRLGAMGDVLHAMPAVAGLRRALPQCFLGWVIEPRWEPLLRAEPSTGTRTAAMPLVDVVHTAHARGWARAPLAPSTWRALRALRRELRQQQYDLAIDLQGAIRSAWIGRMAGARLVGEADPRETPSKWLFDQCVATRGVHVIEQDTEVVAAAVAASVGTAVEAVVEPPLPVSAKAEAWCDTTLGAGDQPLVLIHPGAGWGAKRWPTACFGAVARQLQQANATVLINAGPGEESMAQEVVQASGGQSRALAMTLEQLIAVTRRATLVIGGDTGPLHLAGALGKPVVAIFGPTDPARNGPYPVSAEVQSGVNSTVLRHPTSKRDHSRRREPETGLLSITEDEVTCAALALLRQAETA